MCRFGLLKLRLKPSPIREKCFGAHILSPSLNQKKFPDVGILLVLLGKL